MRIAIVSDTHFSTTDTMLVENWEAAERWLTQIRADLCFHLGDITANGVDSHAELANARALIGRTGVETWCIPGNHDIGDHAAGPGHATDTPFDSVRLSQYRTLFGPDRWSVRAGDWQFIGLNAPLMATGLEEEEIQVRWLRDRLAEADGPVGIFLHKPLFRDHPEEEIVHTRYVPRPARQRLMAAFRNRDVRFVAAGHTHQVRQTVLENVNYVWAPSTAFTVPDFRQERIGDKQVGTMLLEIDGDWHRFTHVVPQGLKSHDLLEFAHIYPALKTLRPPQ